MSASRGADFPMIPRESTLFSSGCKLIPLRVVLCHVTAKASVPQAPWGISWFVAPQGIQVGRAGSKAIDFYALSWGVPRKIACNVVETAQRKSHPLEGSGQEAIPLPHTTFDVFFVAFRSALHPRWAIADASVFSYSWRRLQCAAPVTHLDQGLVTSRCCARRLPLASSMPQKTLGSLPCPIVYNVQIVWLPRGSTLYRAHGRGVA
jgi:hypothetical protein